MTVCIITSGPHKYLGLTTQEKINQFNNTYQNAATFIKNNNDITIVDDLKKITSEFYDKKNYIHIDYSVKNDIKIRGIIGPRAPKKPHKNIPIDMKIYRKMHNKIKKEEKVICDVCNKTVRKDYLKRHKKGKKCKSFNKIMLT